DALHIGLRRIAGHSRFQLPHYAKRMGPIIRALLRREDERRPQLWREGRHGVLGCRDADDGVRLTIETYRTADDRSVARESPYPEAVTEYNEANVARHIGIGEVPSEHGRGVHDSEVSRRHPHTSHSLGLPV